MDLDIVHVTGYMSLVRMALRCKSPVHSRYKSRFEKTIQICFRLWTFFRSDLIDVTTLT